MKLKEERSNSREKKPQKNLNDTMEKNNNPLFPIKYLCFNEVKKIVNNKNKKSPVTNKNNENLKTKNKIDKIKKEEEDDYNQIVYNKRIKINRNLSYTNLNLNLNKNIFSNSIKNESMNKCNSTDERYKKVKMFGFYTKKIYYGTRIINTTITMKTSLVIKKCKFSKKNGKNKKFRNKMKVNNNNYINVNEITNSNNNIIYRTNNINESNNTITSNTITSKTITNNTMSNNTMSNATNNSMNNKKNNINTNPNIIKKIPNIKEHKTELQENKINNIKIIRNKGRNKSNNLDLNINKNIKGQNRKNKENKENENTVFVRRIILEEKFTIDSKGDKKTIYIKKISPIIKTNEIMNSADKRLRNKKMNKNNNNKDKDNTYINHNDINLNFNVCSFQKINLNNSYQKNKLLSLHQKMDSFDEENKAININNSINDTILRNYKDFLNIKKCNKIIYQKPNGILYKIENNHKSYQSLFQSPDRKYLMQLTENDLDKNNGNLYDGKNKNKNNNYKEVKKIDKNKKHNSPLNYILSYPRCLKNKMVHRKTKTNFVLPNNKEENENGNLLTPKESKGSFANKRSLSFVGKIYMQNMVQKLKKGKKIELKDKKKNINTPTPQVSSKNRQNKINDYLYLPIPNNEKHKIKKINSIRNNKKCKNLKKYNIRNKSNISGKNKENSNNNSIRSHSMSKIKVKNNFSSNEIKLFLNYLRNNLIISERNKSHRNFIIKKNDKYNFNHNKSKSNYNSINNSLSNRPNYSNLIYFKSKDMDK